MDRKGLKMEVYCTGVRLVMKDGTIEDHDPVDHNDWVVTNDEIIVNGVYDYPLDSVAEIINYNLFNERMGLGGNYLRKDLDGKELK